MNSETVDWAALHERVRQAEEGLRRGFEPDAAEVEQRLQERARRLAQVSQSFDAPDDEISLLEFQIAGRRMAVDSRHVREVMAEATPTPVPQAPHWVLGLVHIRGEMLTVLDFQALTGTGSRDGGGLLLVLAHRGRTLGLMTDAILGLHKASRGALDAVPAQVRGHRRFYLGVSRQDVLVLDGEQFFEDGALMGAGAEGSAVTQGVAR